MRYLYLLLAVAVIGCAKIHLDCSSGLPQTFAITGSTVGNQLVALGVAAAAGMGGVGAKQGDTVTASTTQGSTLDYSYVPIFGPDNGGLGCGAIQPPTTTINNAQGGVVNMPTQGPPVIR